MLLTTASPLATTDPNARLSFGARSANDRRHCHLDGGSGYNGVRENCSAGEMIAENYFDFGENRPFVMRHRRTITTLVVVVLLVAAVFGGVHGALSLMRVSEDNNGEADIISTPPKDEEASLNNVDDKEPISTSVKTDEFLSALAPSSHEMEREAKHPKSLDIAKWPAVCVEHRLVSNHSLTNPTTMVDTVVAAANEEENLSMGKRKKKWTMKDYIKHPRIRPQPSAQVIWLGDAEFLTPNNNSDYVKFTIVERDNLKRLGIKAAQSLEASGDTEAATATLVQELFLRDAELGVYSDLSFSADADYVAIWREKHKVFRHSKRATIDVVRVVDDKERKAGKRLKPVAELKNAQLFVWNPSTHGGVTSRQNDFVYVRDNRVFYCATPAQATQDRCTQIAPSEKHDDEGPYVYYGIADWIYEEEVLQTSKALWWSPSGAMLAYMYIDDRNVTKRQVPFSTVPSFSSKLQPQNPTTYELFPYPKVGESNVPRVSLYVWRRADGRRFYIRPPPEIRRASIRDDYILFWVGWVNQQPWNAIISPPADRLLSVWANRKQNFVVISICDQLGLDPLTAQEEETAGDVGEDGEDVDDGSLKISCRTLSTFNFSEVGGLRLWAEPANFNILHFSESGFFIILPYSNSAGDSSLSSSSSENGENRPSEDVFDSVAHVDLKTGRVTGVHGGPFDVDAIAGYDQARDELFFHSGGGSLATTHLYRIPTASGAHGITPQCITCARRYAEATTTPHQRHKQHRLRVLKRHFDAPNAADDMADVCGFVSQTVFSDTVTSGSQQRSFVLECCTPFERNRMYVKRTENVLESLPIEPQYFPLLNEEERNIENVTRLLNEFRLKKKSHPVGDLDERKDEDVGRMGEAAVLFAGAMRTTQMTDDNMPPIPSMRFLTVNTSHEYEANIRLLLPADFDESSGRRHPVLLYLYAGPGTSMAMNVTPLSALSYWAAARDYVVVSIDARGCSRRGWRLRSPLYGHFGRPEIEDQIDVMRILLKRYAAFMDEKRVAVFGWSYGGFASASIAVSDFGRTFRCAISVAPVTDFRFYDSIYTERYMGLLAENSDGYRDASLFRNRTRLTDTFRRVQLFLGHGLADDNVHYENSALLASQLQLSEVHFVQHVYGNQDHSITQSKVHIFTEMERFLDDCFR